MAERDSWAEVAEMANVATDSRITASNYSIYDPSPLDAGWSGVMWIWGAPGYVETTFTTPSDSLFAQFESGSNDGLADIYVDGVLELSLNTPMGSWFSVVLTDLSWGIHTIRVTAASSGFPHDLAIDAIDSGAPGSKSVPEPATVLLLGGGLFGLGVRKRFSKIL